MIQTFFNNKSLCWRTWPKVDNTDRYQNMWNPFARTEMRNRWLSIVTVYLADNINNTSHNNFRQNSPTFGYVFRITLPPHPKSIRVRIGNGSIGITVLDMVPIISHNTGQDKSKRNQNHTQDQEQETQLSTSHGEPWRAERDLELAGVDEAVVKTAPFAYCYLLITGYGSPVTTQYLGLYLNTKWRDEERRKRGGSQKRILN